MPFESNTYCNGYLKRLKGGRYEGELAIEGVDLSPIVGVYFKEKGKDYLWLKRKRIVEYDFNSDSFLTRTPTPIWECYLERKAQGKMMVYSGTFAFLHFKYEIVGTFDEVFKDEHRINFFIERLPSSQQTIINGIKKRNNDEL